LVVVLGILLAVVKPWNGFGPAASDGGGGSGPVTVGVHLVGPSAALTPTPSPTQPDAASIARAAVNAECNQPSGWRLYDIDRWRDKPIHVWVAIDAVRASNPLDPSIEVLPVVATTVDALGFCAPIVGSVPSPHADGLVHIWRLSTPPGGSETVATLLPALRVSPILPAGVETALGGLYSAPRSADDGSGGWAAGTYVLSVDGWWFGADVRLVSDTGLPVTPTSAPAP
ncbi:MAG TPA: hypothetical protein VK656_04785, partial [Candidatus Acidoferrum sp.]|nr:hypothetical protein [Candidatus Acidoferrum sp.]